MNNRKLNALLRPTKSRMVYETNHLFTQLQKLSRDERHEQIWNWIKQGKISFQQFSILLKNLEKIDAGN